MATFSRNGLAQGEESDHAQSLSDVSMEDGNGPTTPSPPAQLDGGPKSGRLFTSKLEKMMKEEPGYIQRVNGDSILIPSTTKFVEHALRKHFPDIKAESFEHDLRTEGYRKQRGKRGAEGSLWVPKKAPQLDDPAQQDAVQEQSLSACAPVAVDVAPRPLGQLDMGAKVEKLQDGLDEVKTILAKVLLCLGEMEGQSKKTSALLQDILKTVRPPYHGNGSLNITVDQSIPQTDEAAGYGGTAGASALKPQASAPEDPRGAPFDLGIEAFYNPVDPAFPIGPSAHFEPSAYDFEAIPGIPQASLGGYTAPGGPLQQAGSGFSFDAIYTPHDELVGGNNLVGSVFPDALENPKPFAAQSPILYFPQPEPPGANGPGAHPPPGGDLDSFYDPVTPQEQQQVIWPRTPHSAIPEQAQTFIQNSVTASAVTPSRMSVIRPEPLAPRVDCPEPQFHVFQSPPMRYNAQAASITSTLKHKPSSSRADIPSTPVAQLSSPDWRGSFARDEKVLLNVGGRQPPQNSGSKRPVVVRPTERRLAGIRKVPQTSQHSTASSFETYSPKARSGGLPGTVGYVSRHAGATKATPDPPANALNMDIQVARQSRLGLPVERSPLSSPLALLTDDLFPLSPYMATSEPPVYSRNEEWSKHRPRRGPLPRAPSFGIRRQGLIGQIPGSFPSESDTESIATSEDSVSRGHSSSTDNMRTSRYARLLKAIGM